MGVQGTRVVVPGNTFQTTSNSNSEHPSNSPSNTIIFQFKPTEKNICHPDANATNALSFSSIGTFPNEKKNLLFLSPSPTMALLQFQAQLCEVIKKEEIEIGEEFKADAWIPYCVIAQEVSKPRMAEAFCVLRELKLLVSRYAMDIGLVEFSPVREHFSFGLGNTVDFITKKL
ncbi:hypothetical protein GQ457_16G017400 [Hibiscus cannabinus]